MLTISILHLSKGQTVNISWPLHFPKAHNNLAVAQVIAPLVRRSRPPTRDFDVAAKRLYDILFGQTLDFQMSFQVLLNTIATIEQVKIKTLGVRGPTDTSNDLMLAVSIAWVRQCAFTDRDVTKVYDLMEQVRLAADERVAWYYPKLVNIYAPLAHRHMFEMWARESLAHSFDYQYELLEAAIPGLRGEIDGIAEALASLRRYGVKSCFFQDGMLHDSSEAWVYADWFEHVDSRLSPTDTRGRLADSSISLAMIWLSGAASAATSSATVERFTRGVTRANVPRFDVSTRLSFSLDLNGEIDLSSGTGLLMARPIAVALGMENGYEFLRLSHILRTFDLTVAHEQVKELPRLPALDQAGILDRLRRNRAASMIPELVIPRLKLIESLDSIKARIEQELEQGEAETVARSGRQIGRHEVEWFVRPLPAGHHPSAQARARAAAKNIVLGDNETFVKKHWRGKGPPKTSRHKAVKRKRKRQ